MATVYDAPSGLTNIYFAPSSLVGHAVWLRSRVFGRIGYSTLMHVLTIGTIGRPDSSEHVACCVLSSLHCAFIRSSQTITKSVIQKFEDNRGFVSPRLRFDYCYNALVFTKNLICCCFRLQNGDKAFQIRRMFYTNCNRGSIPTEQKLNYHY